MPIEHREFDPEAIIFLQDCLDVASATAAKVGNVPPHEELRRTLAMAVIEGATAGIRNRDELIDFALRSLPAFRSVRAN